MKIELTDLSPVKKSMLIEVAPDDVAKETESALKRLALKVSVPGFRRGKAPVSVLRSRYAQELKEDVRERLVSRCFREAAREKQLEPIGDPVLEEVNEEEGAPLSFKTTFEVLPEFELQSYKGVEATRPAARVPDEDVDKALEEIRQSRVQLVTEEGREALTGDVIVADVEGEPEGGEAFRRERMMIEIGAAQNLPAFNEPLLGSAAGQQREFSVDYPAEYGAEALAGKTVGYRVQVHEVKRKVLPALDDELARDLGEFDDLAALRNRVREDLAARKVREVEQAVRQSVLDKVLIDNPIVLPEVLVEHEIRQRLEDFVRNLMMRGIDPQQVELDWAELRKQQEGPARKSVHARLVLDALAGEEGVDVSDEDVEERIRHDAAAMGEAPAKLRARIAEGAGLKALRHQLVREKSLDLLVSVANIHDEE